MKQLTIGRAVLFLVQGVLLVVGWALKALGGALETAAPHRRSHRRPKAAELDKEGYVVKEGTTDLL